ncbi:MAG: ABC transporter ATP-binding protein [Caldilinea sp.]|nr:ABC transporter ATP-binding protein [Caldilineaceae bacterium]MCW5844195.1 ABC transporter ATP-binding protein [Caldilinea sp.]
MQATRKLASFLRPYWLWAILAPLMMMLEVTMDLAQPWLIERIIDEGIARQDIALVMRTGGIMVAVATVGLVGGMACTVFAVLAAQGFGADLRHTLFATMQSLSFGNLDELETGKLITRLTNDVTQVQDLVMMLLRVMVRAPLLMVGSLIMAVITSPQLALLFLVLLPTILLMLVWVIRKTLPLFAGVQQRLDAVNIVMQENLAGVRVVKAFVRDAYERLRFRRANDDLMEQNIRAVRTMAITMPLVMFTLNVGVVAALWFGGVKVQQGELQVGQVIAFINYLTQTLMALTMVSMLVMRISRAEASAVRIDEVLASTPHVQDRTDATGDAVTHGRVAFEQVRFAYNGDEEEPVLKAIDFVAEPGETVAILGATGSGKSSLVHLIPRFYDVSGGRITIDGVDVRDLDQNALRRRIGVALQEPILFSGTIRDNIRYGRPDATDDEVLAAAKLAQAHDFIMTLPGGYDALVGQRGVNLSGGQKQRLAIARALLTDPSILILDDSTSAVDVATEAHIQAGLAALRRGRTTFMVAQRISTVLTADKILVLDDGQVAAAGDHRTLLASSEIYREIYASQLEPELLPRGGPAPGPQPAATNGANGGEVRHG